MGRSLLLASVFLFSCGDDDVSLDGSVPDTSVSDTGTADSALIDAQASDGSGPDTSSDAGTDGGGPDADVALSEVELLVVGDSWGQQVGGVREREGKGDFQHGEIPEEWAADIGSPASGGLLEPSSPKPVCV